MTGLQWSAAADARGWIAGTARVKPAGTSVDVRDQPGTYS